MENQRLVTRKRKARTGNAIYENIDRWHQANSMITDVAVQVGALINGVCSDARDSSTSPESASLITIRFSWTDSPNSADQYGLMRIALAPGDGFVRINATPVMSSDRSGNTFENALSLRELSSQKLGQLLMDVYEQTIKSFTPWACEKARCESPAEPEDSIWHRIRSLAVMQPAELAVQT
jgi:hypothetical protein